MIATIEFPGKVFSSKSEMFCALKTQEHNIISIKKAQVYKSHDKGQPSALNILKSSNTLKSSFEAKENFIYPIISTTNYMDSHLDVHFNGSMGKTVNDQQGKVMYALDHELRYDSILAWPKDVRMFIDKIDWSLVGKNYQGKTEAMIFEIQKDKITRPDVLEKIESKVTEFQNSIRMVYYKIFLGMNSDRKEDKENRDYYEKKINEIVNREKADELGHFWGVEELGIHKEASLVVAGGSNDATSIYTKHIEPGTPTQTDAGNATSKENTRSFYQHLI